MEKISAQEKFEQSVATGQRDLIGHYFIEYQFSMSYMNDHDEAVRPSQLYANAVTLMKKAIGLEATTTIMVNGYDAMNRKREDGYSVRNDMALPHLENLIPELLESGHSEAALNVIDKIGTEQHIPTILDYWTPQRIYKNPKIALDTALFVCRKCNRNETHPEWMERATEIFNPAIQRYANQYSGMQDLLLATHNKPPSGLSALYKRFNRDDLLGQRYKALRPHIAKFVDETITDYAAATSFDKAFSALYSLNFDNEPNFPSDLDTASAASRLFTPALPLANLLASTSSLANHHYRIDWKPKTHFETTAENALRCALQGEASRVVCGKTDGEAVLTTIMDARQHPTGILRDILVKGYIGILQAMPDKDMAAALAIEHIKNNRPSDKLSFNQWEFHEVALSALEQLPEFKASEATTPKDQQEAAEARIKLLSTIARSTRVDYSARTDRDEEGQKLVAQNLTSTLNALARVNPAQAVSAAVTFSRNIVEYGSFYNDPAAQTNSAFVKDTLQALEKKSGPAAALAILVPHVPERSFSGYKLAIDRTLAQAHFELERKLFAPKAVEKSLSPS